MALSVQQPTAAVARSPAEQITERDDVIMSLASKGGYRLLMKITKDERDLIRGLGQYFVTMVERGGGGHFQ